MGDRPTRPPPSVTAIAAAPGWSTEQDWVADGRWVWRREVETVSWWPATPHTDSAPQANHTSPACNFLWADWKCICGQTSWPNRTRCYDCVMPRPQGDAANRENNTEMGTSFAEVTEHMYADTNEKAKEKQLIQHATATTRRSRNNEWE